jgi:hypothetical protein
MRVQRLTPLSLARPPFPLAQCVFQWWWVTGNSCQPPAENPPSSPQLSVCGSANAPYPEEFWNVADVLIYPKVRERKLRAGTRARAHARA